MEGVLVEQRVAYGVGKWDISNDELGLGEREDVGWDKEGVFSALSEAEIEIWEEIDIVLVWMRGAKAAVEIDVEIEMEDVLDGRNEEE